MITRLFLLLLLPIVGGAEVLKTEAVALKEAFPEAASFAPMGLSYTSDLRLRLKEALGRLPGEKAPRLLKALDAKGAQLGLAVVDEELGKHQPITYLVAVGKDGAIRALDMLVFRESQGDGVRSRRFRAQFKGKGLKDPLELGRDLDAVSGATISSRTLAFGARKSLWLAREAAKSDSSQAQKAQPATAKKKQGEK